MPFLGSLSTLPCGTGERVRVSHDYNTWFYIVNSEPEGVKFLCRKDNGACTLGCDGFDDVVLQHSV